MIRRVDLSDVQDEKQAEECTKSLFFSIYVARNGLLACVCLHKDRCAVKRTHVAPAIGHTVNETVRTMPIDHFGKVCVLYGAFVGGYSRSLTNMIAISIKSRRNPGCIYYSMPLIEILSSFCLRLCVYSTTRENKTSSTNHSVNRH